MSNITPSELAAATGETSESLARVPKALGMAPDMTKIMACSPTLLQGHLDLGGALNNGALSDGVRERLAITTAPNNGRAYCSASHTYIGSNIANVDATELEQVRTAQSSDSRIAAIRALSDAFTRCRGQFDSVALGAVREAGATDAEIGEEVGNLSITVLTNLLNIVAGVDIDWPFVELNSAVAR